mgnify:CR=1 FL=1
MRSDDDDDIDLSVDDDIDGNDANKKIKLFVMRLIIPGAKGIKFSIASSAEQYQHCPWFGGDSKSVE